jgi:L-aspartate oxidase
VSRLQPLIVVGAGIAGLSVALASAPRPVLLLSRDPAGLDSATALAQGGIAAAVGVGDTTAAHAQDTFLSGSFHNDAPAVRELVEHAPAALRWLRSQGVSFDHDGMNLHLAREAGHGCARIAHVGGDASGRHLLAALNARVKEAGHIDRRKGVDVDGLLLRGDAVAGVRIRDSRGPDQVLEAHGVVLATGGLGALFALSTNPLGAEGAGLALGLAAGAAGRDLEFVQFHPTAFATGAGDRLPLLTEALRGAGATLHDSCGRPLMSGRHPLADLAPRDVVARRVWQSLAHGEGAFLHAQKLAGAWPRHFPTALALCLEHGLDPREQPIPITPAAHFHMGGLATDLLGRSSVPGLFAVGEVACNGVHGANRLASNSLLEGVVFGRRTGAFLAADGSVAPVGGEYRVVERGPTRGAAQIRQLREQLWRTFGPVREERTMLRTVRAIESLPARELDWRQGLALRLLRAGLQRRSSLGAHWRSDSASESFNLAGPPAIALPPGGFH